jgi:hypothetical protein
VGRVSESIDIRAPRAVVFEAITDPRRTMEWNPNIVDMRELRGYPVGVGSSWIQVTTIAGRPLELHCAVIEWRPPGLGVLDVTGPQKARVTTECADIPGGTRVVQSIDFTPPGGLLGAMAGGIIGQQLGRELSKSLQRQRDSLEREYGGASGFGVA